MSVFLSVCQIYFSFFFLPMSFRNLTLIHEYYITQLTAVHLANRLEEDLRTSQQNLEDLQSSNNWKVDK